MDLRARLRELEARLGVGQRQAPAPPSDVGATTEAASQPAPLPLAARLQRLATAQADKPAKRTVSQEELARIVGGELCAEGVVLVEQFLPLSHRHGSVPFQRIREAALDFLAGGAEPERERLLFIDTETTGLSGGTGTVAFVLGLARIQGDTVEVRQYFLTCFAGETAMLEHALGWIDDHSHLVSFNGKAFDIPLLATRYRLARLANPFATLPHMDLLHRTRAAFKRNWPDCRLQTAEQYLLKLFRDDDLPGHLIPQVWIDLLQFGETRSLRGVVDHNRIDVLSLIALAGVLGKTYAEPGQQYADPLGIARAHRRAGDSSTALLHLEDHGQALTDDARLELAALYAKSGHWDKAVPVWEALAGKDVLCAMERLAIYHEHKEKNFAAALRWTERMLPLSPQVDAVEKRRGRLVRKCKQPGAG
ncbi:MAG: ribonuclease H-like domain-containing protein, partial [Burkholderiales bacterium]|nr:ribonuclease H-like domain-containing protein [Burkholderiales bacterium]